MGGASALGWRRHLLIAVLLLTLSVIIAIDGVGCEDLALHRQSRRHAAASLQYDGLRDSSSVDQEHWTKYIPNPSRTLAEELRAARESERKRAEREARRSANVNNDEDSNGGSIAETVIDSAKSAADAAGISKGVRAVRKAKRKVERVLESDDEEEDDDDDDNGGEHSSKSTTSRRRKSIKKVRATTTSLWSFAVSAARNGFWIAVAISRYLYNNCVWTPMTYAAVALRWSANASWQTTQWTSERALFGPVRTATAPLVYLVEGLLFIFVMVPARFIRAVVRELYPVYVFLGAALAVGMAMGIAAAAVLFVGSYVLGDQSELETSLQRRGEQLPNDIQKHLRDQYVEPYLDGKTGKLSSTLAPDASWQSAAVRAGEGVIQKAIRESLLREERKNARLRQQNEGVMDDEEGEQNEDENSYERAAWQDASSFQRAGTAPDSDEDDDYFGASGLVSSAATKGKAAALQGARRVRQQAPSSLTPPVSSAPLGGGTYQRSLPAGATSHGGWGSRSDSSASTPAASPLFARTTNLSASPYAMATSSSRSPLVSPTTASHPLSGPETGLRTHHIRQRRGVPYATSVV